MRNPTFEQALHHQAVLDNGGEVSIDQVLGIVAKRIPAPNAIRSGKRQTEYQRKRKNPLKNKEYSPEDYARIGRRRKVRETLNALCVVGKLMRVRPGVFKAPFPKLFHPPNEARPRKEAG
ncbi:MAG: hypothetical protein KGL39_00780 [Patescibacteria group bacterium]|nr:hypothetical protein [Patescibacteria group bacterium]